MRPGGDPEEDEDGDGKPWPQKGPLWEPTLFWDLGNQSWHLIWQGIGNALGVDCDVLEARLSNNESMLSTEDLTVQECTLQTLMTVWEGGK